MFSTCKQLFLTCAKSPHSKRKWRTVNGVSQPSHFTGSGNVTVLMILFIRTDIDGAKKLFASCYSWSNNFKPSGVCLLIARPCTVSMCTVCLLTVSEKLYSKLLGISIHCDTYLPGTF